MPELIYLLILISAGYFVGTLVEKKHYKSIQGRERQLLGLSAVTGKNLIETDVEIEKAQLVYGSVVISYDYFKRTLAGLRNILGGRISAYETLLDRARREAILRLKEMTKDADIILNLRLETTRVSHGGVEVLAYGTAIYYKR